MFGLSFSPQATLNYTYALAVLKAKVAGINATQLNVIKVEIEEKYANKFQMDYTLYAKKNPMGRILNTVANLDYAAYFERQHDLDGYLNIVNIQRNVLAKGLATDKLTGINLHDPYTQKLMQFDQNTDVLTFAGRQPSNTNFNKLIYIK